MNITLKNIETIKIDTVEKFEGSIKLLIDLVNKFDDKYDMELEQAIIIIFNIINTASEQIIIKSKMEQLAFDELMQYFEKCSYSIDKLQEYYSQNVELVKR